MLKEKYQKMATNSYIKCKDCNGNGTISLVHSEVSKPVKCKTCNGKGSIKIKLPIKINKKKK